MKAYIRSFRIQGSLGGISVPVENGDSGPRRIRTWVLTCFVFEELGALVDLLMEMSHWNDDEQDIVGPRHNFFLISVPL